MMTQEVVISEWDNIAEVVATFAKEIPRAEALDVLRCYSPEERIAITPQEILINYSLYRVAVLKKAALFETPPKMQPAQIIELFRLDCIDLPIIVAASTMLRVADSESSNSRAELANPITFLSNRQILGAINDDPTVRNEFQQEMAVRGYSTKPLEAMAQSVGIYRDSLQSQINSTVTNTNPALTVNVERSEFERISAQLQRFMQELERLLKLLLNNPSLTGSINNLKAWITNLLNNSRLGPVEVFQLRTLAMAYVTITS